MKFDYLRKQVIVPDWLLNQDTVSLKYFLYALPVAEEILQLRSPVGCCATRTIFLFYINIVPDCCHCYRMMKPGLLLITFSFSFPVRSAQQWFLINSKDLFLGTVEFSDLLSTVNIISFQLNVKDELSYSG